MLPRQLPSAVRHFAGRDAELKALWEVLDQAQERPGAVVISAIGGMAGVGKTALAVHFAQQAAGRFPDGQLFADLRGVGPADDPADPARVIGWFLASLGVPATQVPADSQAQAALLRSVLADKRMLIVLDNARDAGQVRPLLPGSPGCLVLVTSRARLTGLAAADGATVIDLDVLDAADAYELLARRLGRVRLAAEPAACAELVALCGRLPLALAITAARAAARPGFPLAVLAAELRDEAGRLDALDTGEPASSVRQVFSWSFRQLSDPAATMFRLLGVHPGPDISAPAAASLAGVSPAAARHALTELTDAHLLASPGSGRYALHDLLRAYAAELAHATSDEKQQHAAIHRALDHYLHTAHHAVLLINPSREEIALAPARPGVAPERFADNRQALAWFEAEHQVLLAAAALAADTRSDAGAWQLAWAVANFLDGQGRWHDMAVVQRGALDAATRLGDTAGQSAARSALANTYASLGDYHQARTHLAASLSLSRRLGDRAGEARAHLILGFVYDRQERYADALSHAEQALVLFRAIASPRGQTSALNAVGWCHARLGDYQQARAFCQQALVVYREIGDRYGESNTLDSLGYAEHHLGRYADAVASYNRAIALKTELGHRVSEAETFDHLGDTHHAAGHRDAARHAWQQALGILDDLQHPDAGKVRAKLL
jgi:tetratricopeptide (TPR) repeat protein